MDTLLATYTQIPINKYKPTKHVVKGELEANKPEQLIYTNKVFIVNARLINEHTGEFTDKYFHKYLCSQYDAIKQIACNVKKTFTNTEFYFCTKYNVNYLDASGLTCDPQKLLGRTCKFKVKVVPYKREDIGGLQIRVFEVRL